MLSDRTSPSAASSTLSAPSPSSLSCRRSTVAAAAAAAPPSPLSGVHDAHRHRGHPTLSTSTSSLPSDSARGADDSSDVSDDGELGGAEVHAVREARTSPTRTYADSEAPDLEEESGGGGKALWRWRSLAGVRQQVVAVPSTDVGNCSGGGQTMGVTTLGNTSTSSSSSSDAVVAAGAALHGAPVEGPRVSLSLKGQSTQQEPRDTPLLTHLRLSAEPVDAAPIGTSSSSVCGPSPPLTPQGADAAPAVAPTWLHGLLGADAVALPRALTAALSVARGASMPQSASQPAATQHTRSSSPSVRSPTPLDLTAAPKLRHHAQRSSDACERDTYAQQPSQPQQQRRLSFSGYSSAPASVPSDAASISPPPLCEYHHHPPAAPTTSFSLPTITTAIPISTAGAAGTHNAAHPFQSDTDALRSAPDTAVTPPWLAPAPPGVLESPKLRARAPARPLAYQHPPAAAPRALAFVDADGYALPAPMPLLHHTAPAAPTARPRATSVPLASTHPCHRPAPTRHRLHPGDDDDIDGEAGAAAYGGSGNSISGATAAAAVGGAVGTEPPPPCLPRVVPTHESVFFPLGTDVVAPVLLHYVTVAGWSTSAGGRDFFNHRRLRGGEVAGHTVRWLHTARPRNCFVFVVTPVVNRTAQLASEAAALASSQTSTADSATPHREAALRPPLQRGWRRPRQLWQQLRSRLFGEAPWFTYATPSAHARSRIAQVEKVDDEDEDEDSDSVDAADVGDDDAKGSTPSSASVGEAGRREMDSGSRHANRSGSEASCMGDSITIGSSSSVGGGEGSGPRRSPHARQTAATLADALVGADVDATPVRRSRQRQCTPPYSMSPSLVVRPASRSSVASAAPSASRTPPSARLALADETWPPCLHCATTRIDSPAAHNPPRHSSSLATPSTGLVSTFPSHSSPTTVEHLTTPPPLRYGHQRSATPTELRRVSGGGSGYDSFVWSPVTGTAIAAASGATPATPRRPAPSPPQQPPATPRAPRAPSLSPSSVAAAAAAAAAAPASSPPAAGVEVVLIAHVDVTAMDYAPRLTSHRLSIEARVARTFFFPSLAAALQHFQCEEAMELMQEQWAAGMTSQIPRPRVTADVRVRREHAAGKRGRHTSLAATSSSSAAAAAAARRGSRSRSTSLVPASLASSRPPLDRSSGTSPLLAASSMSLRRAMSKEGLHPVRSSPNLGGMLRLGGAMASPLLQDHHHHQHLAIASLPSQSLSLPEALRSSSNTGPPVLLPAVSVAAAPHPTSISVTSPLHLDHPTPTPPPLEPPLLTSTHCEVVVSVYTADPVFSSILRELLIPEPGTHPYTESVAEQKRLLSMVEVGMPAWAVFYSSTGLPYRRLARLLYSGLTNLWPLLSLAVGLYDLYKHLPQLKRFMEHTFEPLTRWLERRFTLRVSVLVTYLISVVVTIFSSLSSFVAQFYLVQLFSLPIVQLVLALIKLPFVLAFDTVWAVATALWGTASLVLHLVRVVVMAPLVLVTNLASLRDTFGAAVPAAVEGTSMSVKWWRTFMEFWETVASPIKNAARAWWDSMMHVSTSAARRETSIRRWSSPKLERLATLVGEVHDCVAINVQLWWTDVLLPGLEHQALMAVVVVYLYWLFLVISPELWDEVIYASGVRRPLAPAAAATTAAGAASPRSWGPAEQEDGSLRGTSPVPATAATRTTTTCAALSDMDASFFFHGTRCEAELDDAAQRSSSAAPSPVSPTTTTNTPSPTGADLHAPTSGAAAAAVERPRAGTDALFSLDLHHDTFAALVAELLLPNAVLGMLQRVRRAAGQGWSGAVASATRLEQRQERRRQQSRHVNHSLSRVAAQPQSNSCDGVNATGAVTGLELCAASSTALTYSDAGCSTQSSRRCSGAAIGDNATATTEPPPRRVWRYVNPVEVDVRWAGDATFGFPQDLLVAWRAATVARWGDVVGRETPRLTAVVPAAHEGDVAGAGSGV